MPLLAYLASYHWRARHRYANTLAMVLLLVLAVQWCIAFTLGGRGLFVGLLVAHVALLVLFPRYWRLLAWQLGAALLGLLLFVLLFVAIPELLNVTPHLRDAFREGLSGRNVIWTLAWKLFVAHPGLGVGPLMFAAHVNPVAAHPHQVVLQWLAEWGLPATAMAIVLAAWGMWRGLTVVRHDASRPLDAALWLSIAWKLPGSSLAFKVKPSLDAAICSLEFVLFSSFLLTPMRPLTNGPERCHAGSRRRFA